MIKKIYQLIVLNLRTKLSRPQFIMFIATLVGLASGMMAVLLKLLVHFLQTSLVAANSGQWLYLFFPAIGLLITVFIIKYFFGNQLQKGIAMVLKMIAVKFSFIPMKHTYAHALTSAVTVGLGGSAGLESPIVSTGSAIGSNIARISDLNYQERSLMIACGASAGIAAVFNAPIAGVIFAVEVLLSETIISYFIPLIISSVIGVLCSSIILHETALFNFMLAEVFNYRNVPYYILLGILCGFVSLYYAKVFKRTEQQIHKWKINAYLKALIGGGMLLCLYFVFPPLFGEGYESIKLAAGGMFERVDDHTTLLSGMPAEWSIILFAGSLFLLKPVAAAITIGSGGNGGNFAPSLFTGAFLGFFFSKMLNRISWINVPESNFTLVAMAGLLSGVMYCPLTAIFLIAEITNGYGLFIPLMLVSSLSFFIVKSYEPYSMETKQLALQGEIFTHKKEKNILTSIKTADIIQPDYAVLDISQTLKDLVEEIKKTDKNVFAVANKEGKFVGIIELNDIKGRLFQPENFEKILILNLLKKPSATIRIEDNMHRVMEKFDITQSWQLPVLDENGAFIGFISKTKLFQKYREILASQVDMYE